MTRSTALTRFAFIARVGLMFVSCAPRLLSAQAAPQPSYPFQNPNLAISRRVDDLVSHMTLPEKVSQMMTDAAAIPRLGIPAYYWWSECLHGNAGGVATVFPQAIGLAAAWDVPQHALISDAISDEDRARYNLSLPSGTPLPFQGLTFFAPNINIFRDPRWGRGQETYGEDPFLTATLGITFVKGLQGSDPHYLKVVATPKHFAVHSGPEPERHQFNAVVTAYDLHDTYLPAFEAAVREGHAQSVMGAYSSLYGVPCCASPLLLQQTLRDEAGFDGYIVSDCGAIYDIFGNHHYAKSAEEASALAVKAGCDLACDGTYGALTNAVKQGLIREAEIDRSVKRLFTARFRLGMFDPPSRVRYAHIPASAIDSPAHRQLALRASRESLVLLKNENHLLPLSGTVNNIAVIGPNANSRDVLLGNYNGTPSRATTALAGIRQLAASRHIRVEYAQGCGLTDKETAAELISSANLRFDGKPGLRAEYFGNEKLDGKPALTTRAEQVDFNWSGVSPSPKVPLHHFSARFTGQIVVPEDGEYIVSVRGDDGFRLYLNDRAVIDDWTIHPAETKSITVSLRASEPAAVRLEYFQGEGQAELSMLWAHPGADPVRQAIETARRADVVIFAGGISAALEGEEGTNGGGDRTDLKLPAVQEKLLEQLAETGKPIVLVLMNGSALAVNWAAQHLPAIVEAWYPGEEGGTAVAEALFGVTNPAGRLPVTFYKSVDQLPDFHDYAMKNRTYRYFTGEPLFPFGFGLSYTQFRYRSLKLPAEVAAHQKVTVSVEVENSGERAGDEVTELYLRPSPDMPEGRRTIGRDQPMPRLVLAGFQRITLSPRQRKTVTFILKPEQLLLVDQAGKRDLQPGRWQVFVGSHQPNSFNAVQGEGDEVSNSLTVKP